MKRYVSHKSSSGVHILNLEDTWQKIKLAARIIAGVDNPEDVIVSLLPKMTFKTCLLGGLRKTLWSTRGDEVRQIHWRSCHLLLKMDPRYFDQPEHQEVDPKLIHIHIPFPLLGSSNPDF